MVNPLTASVKPSRPPVTKTRIQYIPDDESDYEDTTEEPNSKDNKQPWATTPYISPKGCAYDPCTVSKVPCSVIAAETKCYCPGISGPEEIPAPPRLKELKQGAFGEVEVHWCAPLSTVTEYILIVDDGSFNPPAFSESLRSGTLQEVKVGSRVCVVAVNNAGYSTKSETSCSRFEPNEHNQVALISMITAGGIGFLLLVIVVTLLLWKWRKTIKNAMVDTEGLRNPSYTTNEML